MKIEKNKWFYIILLLVIFSFFSCVLPEENPYEESINAIALKLNLNSEELSLIKGSYSKLFMINFVDIELNVVIKNKLMIVKAKLYKYPLQNKYVTRSISKIIKRKS